MKMAEASIAAFGVAICVAISLVVCFAICGKEHHDDAPVTIRE